jgi:diaminopimelate decarboxylase
MLRRIGPTPVDTPGDAAPGTVRDGRLVVEDLDAVELARRFGTPLHVISEARVRHNARRFASAFARGWPHGPVEILPAFKACPVLAVRRVLTAEGMGCDVFGAAELRAALDCGVPGPAISLNGPAKDRALLGRAIRAGARITLDDPAELGALRAAIADAGAGATATVRLRLRPDYTALAAPSAFEADGRPVAESAHAYKAGIPPEQATDLARALLAEPGVDLAGVMVHLGRHRADLATWAAMADRVAAVTAELVAALDGWRPRELDVGGGFATPRDPLVRGPEHDGDLAALAPDVDEYAEVLTAALGDGLTARGVAPRGMTLQVEPGRALHADAGLHLTTVLGVKRTRRPTPRTWVQTDTSEAFLMDTLVEGNRWPVLVAGRAATVAVERVDVVGCSCGFDVLVEGVRLPAVAAGDVLALLDTGAYQEALATNFNALPRPATVLVGGGGAEVVRRRETHADVFARDRIPARLGGRAGAGVAGVDHVSVSCADLGRSLAFYRDALGLAVTAEGTDDDPALAQLVGLAGARVRYAELDLGQGLMLELLEYEQPRGRPVQAEPCDPGAAHLSLRVGDLDAALRRVCPPGDGDGDGTAAVTLGGTGWEGARAAYVRDPDGFVVELLERPPG